MKRFGTFVAGLSAALLVVAAAVPVAAAPPAGKAAGLVTWDGEAGDRPGRTSVFRVRDGRPGQVSTRRDRGFYVYSEYNDQKRGRLRMRVSCVRVDGNVAEFSGRITRATGIYAGAVEAGNTFLVQVVDGGRPGAGVDGIGMKSYDSVNEACDAVVADWQWPGRNGIVTGGNLWVRDPR